MSDPSAADDSSTASEANGQYEVSGAPDGVADTESGSSEQAAEPASDQTDDTPDEAANAEADSPADTESGTGDDSAADSDGDGEIPTGVPQTFNATIEVSALTNFLNTAATIVDEAKLVVSETGLRIRAADAANVAMVDTELDAASFERFTATPGVIGVDLGTLQDTMSVPDSGSAVSLEWEQETRKLHISADHLSYTMASLDPDSIRDAPDIPALDLPFVADVSVSQLNRGKQAADMVSDYIRFAETDESDLRISAEGDTDDVEFVVEEDEDDALDVVESGNGEADTLLALDYLKDVARAFPSSGSVTLHLGDDFPARIEFLQDGGTHSTEFLIAPRIQSD